MQTPLRFCRLLLAASVLAISVPALADKDPGDDPPPTTPPPSSQPEEKVQLHKPHSTCEAQDEDGVHPPVACTNLLKIDIATQKPITSDSSATMMYFWLGSAFDSIVNAHKLDAGSQWTLTYQPEPLPSNGVTCLGNGTVDSAGQLHLANSLVLKSHLPPKLDPTAEPSKEAPDALLALVPSADVDCSGGKMTTFAPDKYLWSQPRVRYVNTDLLPKTTP